MTTGIIFGVFDLLHVGHLVMLEEARRQCDYLIVGLRTDVSDVELPPVQTVVERFIKLQGCRFIDEIIPFESDTNLIDILQSLPIDIRFVGEEHTTDDFPGRKLCIREGIKIVFVKRRHRFSSESLRNTVSQKEALKNGQNHCRDYQ